VLTVWWTWSTVTGALVRRVPAQIVNLSASGCLIESAAPLPPGVVGVLELETPERTHREAVRISYGHHRPGSAAPFCAGVEFLVFDAAESGSIREHVWGTAAPHAAARLARAGENSGTSRTSAKVAGRRRRDHDAEMSSDGKEMCAGLTGNCSWQTACSAVGQRFGVEITTNSDD
jgi:hypothetical protein